jgi:NAD-dependent dihydropyrimidine dehydrogenase PreA subunit
MFIAVEVDDDIARDPTIAARLAEACPVDIFATGEGGLQIVAENLDECVLCRLCIDAVARRDAVEGQNAVEGKDGVYGQDGVDGRDGVERRETPGVRVMKLYDAGALLA